MAKSAGSKSDPISALERRSTTALQQAQSIQIVDQVTYDRANQLFQDVAALKKEIETHHAPMKKSAYDTWQIAIATEKKVLNPVQAAYDLLSRNIGGYDTKKRMEADAEKRRIEEAAQRQAEEEKQRAASEAHKAGASEEEVEAILDAPPPIIKVQSVATHMKAEDTSLRTRYTAVPWREGVKIPATVQKKDHDAWLLYRAKLKLIKLAAKNPAAFAKYLVLDQSALNNDANRQKELFGIEDVFTYATETKAAPRGSRG